MPDRDLVAAIVAGDPAALAAAYDRYASALYAYCRTLVRAPEDAADALQDTFVVAAQKLGGLRDPDRLRPWLYAVARNECLRRARGPVTVDLDQAGEVNDDAVDVDAGLREADVRSLIWSAISGLNPGEREVFELNVRHELEGADLAAALGVPANHAHALLSRARGQLEKSLGALLVARTGRTDCPDLAAILAGWDGELTALLRKRINRHVEQCEVCGERRRRELRPEMLLGAMPVFLLPPGLRANVLHLVGDSLPGGGPGGGGSGGDGSGGSAGSSNSSDSSARTNSGTAGSESSGAGLANAAIADVAEYRARVAVRAEPFDRDGFPVPLGRRCRPFAAARRRSLMAAALLLLLLLGVGGYAAAQFISPTSAADASARPTPTIVITLTPIGTGTALDTGSPVELTLSPSPASPGVSPSPSASASASPSVRVIVVTTPARSPSPSRSPSRSPSPSPSPAQGVLVAVPSGIITATWAGNDYRGTFNLVARGGPVAGFTIELPGEPAGVPQPSAAPAFAGAMTPNQSIQITVYNIETTGELIYTIVPSGTQSPFPVTVSPSPPPIPIIQ
ncbi:MAG: RNA polymerase sigma factor [Actinocrinis sp.]